MAFDYSSLVAPFSAIIDDFEMGTITIKRRTETADPNDPWDYTVSDSETGINAVVTGVSEKRINGTSIKAGDLFVILSSSSVASAPEITDKVTIDGEEHSVIEVTAVPPAGTAIIYRIQVRSF